MTEITRTVILLGILIAAAIAHAVGGWIPGEHIARDAWIALLALLNPQHALKSAARFTGGLFHKPEPDERKESS